MVYAALAAAAAAFELGLTDRELLRGIAEYETVGRRARIIRTGRLTIVDDCYNANPTSMVAALRSLMSLPGRHVCILGDMLELGEDAGALHYETGKKAAELGADLVVGGGLLAERICEGAATAGAETVYFGGKAAIIEALPELLRSGDAVLIKASRSMKFEDITAAAERL